MIHTSSPRPTMTPARFSRHSLISWLLSLAVLLLGPIGLDATAQPALASGPQSCAAIDTRQVEALFERWDRALRSGEPQQVSALYSSDALLLPTLSSVPRSDHDAITDYFASFLAQAPEARIDSREIRLGCNQALDAGTYSFLLHPPGGAAQQLQARYSLVYVYRDGDWQILHHHSSLMPRG